MTPIAGTTFGILGPLEAFPRRLAAREVERQGGHLRSGVTRNTTHVVFGRKLLARLNEAKLAERFDEQCRAGRVPLSENAFLRALGVLPTPPDGSVGRSSLVEQARLSERELGFLSLFDAFEHSGEPYSFRDIILARKYAGLIAGGASWTAIARSVHRASGPVTSLTALSFEAVGRDSIYARLGGARGELDGQYLLPMDRSGDDDLESWFETAREAEADGRFDEAATLYARCLALDPADAVAAFNRANCLLPEGRRDEARLAFLQALKFDAAFAEAWFNLAALEREEGRTVAARDCLQKAVTVDGKYADAVYNLATLEFDAGNLADARRWWVRYLELDPSSDWARNAAKGIQYVDRHLGRRSAG